MHETQVLSLGGEDALEEEMATHSNILALKIPWTEEPVRGVRESDMTELLNTHIPIKPSHVKTYIMTSMPSYPSWALAKLASSFP